MRPIFPPEIFYYAFIESFPLPAVIYVRSIVIETSSFRPFTGPQVHDDRVKH